MSPADLARLARVSQTRATWRPLRAVCLIIGVFAICMAGSLSAMAVSRDAVISNRSQDLLAVRASDTNPPTFLIDDRFQTIGSEQIVVITIEPLTSGAPVPPGLSRWPRPGEAALSPSVRRMGVGDMFGRPTQTIAISGLESVTDPRVYVRPAPGTLDRSRLRPAYAFGDDDLSELASSVGLAFLNRLGIGYVLACVWGTLGFAGLVALITAAGMGGDIARRRVRRLAALGASRPQLVVMRWIECAGPIAIGLAAGALVTTVLRTLTLTLPWLREITAPADLRGRPGLLLATPLVTMVITFAVLAIPVWRTLNPRRATRGRFFVPQDTLPTTRAWICMAAVIVCLWVPPMLTGPQRQQAYILCVIIVACTLSAVVAVLVNALGRAISSPRLGWNAPAALTAGRLMQARPRRTARMLTAICLAILTLGQVQLSVGLLGSQFQAGDAAQRAVDNSVLVASDVLPTRQVRAFLATLPPTERPVWVETQLPQRGRAIPSQSVSATECPELGALGLPCAATGGPIDLRTLPLRTQATFAALGGGATRVRVGDPCPAQGRNQCQLLIVSTTGSPLSVRDLTRESTAYVAGGLRLESVAASAISGSEPNRIRARWIVLYGTIAIALLTLAMAAMLTSETVSDARRLSVLAAVRGNRRWLWQHAALSVFLPIAAAGFLATLIYFLLPTAISTADARLEPSDAYATSAIVAALVIGAVAAAVSVRATRTTDPLAVRRG